MAVKHIKGINRKAKQLERRIKDGEQKTVQGLQLPMGCTTVFDPGWETDSSTQSLFFACQPMERDVYGCYGDCWWAAQVPDGLVKHTTWHEECPAAVRDWQKLKFVGE
mgnify:CR=1 FL=1